MNVRTMRLPSPPILLYKSLLQSDIFFFFLDKDIFLVLVVLVLEPLSWGSDQVWVSGQRSWNFEGEVQIKSGYQVKCLETYKVRFKSSLGVGSNQVKGLETFKVRFKASLGIKSKVLKFLRGDSNWVWVSSQIKSGCRVKSSQVNWWSYQEEHQGWFSRDPLPVFSVGLEY